MTKRQLSLPVTESGNALLDAFDIGAGDEVIIPAYTCVVVPNALLYRGARPVYADIELHTFNLDPEKIESLITPRTRAIVAQHTFGQPCQIERIIEVARRHQLIVIEDCAHAIGATYQGRKLGTWGDAAFASTDHTKVISTSVGGFALTASSEIAIKLKKIQTLAFRLPWHARLRIICQYAILAVLNRPSIYRLGRYAIAAGWKLNFWFYFRDELATDKPRLYPVQLSNFQAYVGVHEMQALDRNVLHRRTIADGLRKIFFPDQSKLPEGAYLRYSILVQSPKEWEDRIGGSFSIKNRWFTSIAHGRHNDLEKIRYHPGSCPNGEYAAMHVVNFPTHFRADPLMVVRLRKLVEEHHLRETLVSDASLEQHRPAVAEVL